MAILNFEHEGLLGLSVTSDKNDRHALKPLYSNFHASCQMCTKKLLIHCTKYLDDDLK